MSISEVMLDKEFERTRAEFLRLLDLDILDYETPENMRLDRPDLKERIPPLARVLATEYQALGERMENDKQSGNTKALEEHKAIPDTVTFRFPSRKMPGL